MSQAAHVASCGLVTIRLQGTITPDTALKTLTRAAELACDRVVVDVSGVPEVSDAFLAFVAGGLVALRRSNVSLVGVPPHQEALLASLGVRSLLQHSYSA